MKKLETLKKELANITTDELANIVNCTNVDCETLTDADKIAILVFNEYSKSMKSNKAVSLVLDCNYSNSKLHEKNQYLVDYFRITDEHNDCLARCYIHTRHSKKDDTLAVTTDIRFSCKKAVLAQTDALEKADFEVFRYKATQKVRNVRKQAVAYDDFVQTMKDALLILSNSKTVTAEKDSDAE